MMKKWIKPTTGRYGNKIKCSKPHNNIIQLNYLGHGYLTAWVHEGSFFLSSILPSSLYVSENWERCCTGKRWCLHQVARKTHVCVLRSPIISYLILPFICCQQAKGKCPRFLSQSLNHQAIFSKCFHHHGFDMVCVSFSTYCFCLLPSSAWTM